jgi:hypothetical protein
MNVRMGIWICLLDGEPAPDHHSPTKSPGQTTHQTVDQTLDLCCEPLFLVGE